MKKMIILVVAVSVAGCAAPARQMRLDGKPISDGNDVATVVIHDHQQFPGQPLTVHWWSNIVAIDGNQIPKSGVGSIQLSPGSHKFEFDCGGYFSVNDFGPAKGSGSAVFSLSAGKKYWPSVALHLVSQEWRNGYPTSSGTCEISQMMLENPVMRAL